MLVLSLESAREEKSLALVENGLLVAETFFAGDLRECFWPLLDSFLDENNRRIRDCELFAVNRGPGSWTGLRFGLAVVKGWASAFGGRVFALSDEEIEKLSFPSSVRVLTAAGRLALAARPERAVSAAEVLPVYGHLPRFRKLGEKISVSESEKDCATENGKKSR